MFLFVYIKLRSYFHDSFDCILYTFYLQRICILSVVVCFLLLINMPHYFKSSMKSLFWKPIIVFSLFVKMLIALNHNKKYYYEGTYETSWDEKFALTVTMGVCCNWLLLLDYCNFFSPGIFSEVQMQNMFLHLPCLIPYFICSDKMWLFQL